jgi:hypothetical protein
MINRTQTLTNFATEFSCFHWIQLVTMEIRLQSYEWAKKKQISETYQYPCQLAVFGAFDQLRRLLSRKIHQSESARFFLQPNNQSKQQSTILSPSFHYIQSYPIFAKRTISCLMRGRWLVTMSSVAASAVLPLGTECAPFNQKNRILKRTKKDK